MGAPLEGVKVLDLATMVLGPLAAQYLGDMGAEVIKVEPPEGDLMRQIGPRHSDGMGAFFLGNNRNKKSIVLDLKTEQGLETLHALVRESDVVIHSVRTTAAKRLGISYEALRAQNPRVVYCHVKGYSDEGPYAGRPAYDDVGQAESGLAMMQQAVAGQPRYVPSIMADKVTALHAAFGIVTALFQRTVTGVGQAVHVPMFETMVAFNVVEHMWGETFIPKLAEAGYVPVSSGARRPFLTKDGKYICVLPYNEGHWRRFCEAVGDPELTADPRYSTFAARQSDQPAFWAEVGRRVLKRDYQEWIDLLGDSDVPFARVNSITDLLDDPHLKSVDFWQTIDHPTEGMLRMPSNPMTMTGSTPAAPSPPPLLGQHTFSIMRNLGLSDEAIERLADDGVFGRVKLRAETI
jgi:crotonobetainyl-CoA:carnitine CoA-transferase CaiB-like acyl-CoA transferase